MCGKCCGAIWASAVRKRRWHGVTGAIKSHSFIIALNINKLSFSAQRWKSLVMRHMTKIASWTQRVNIPLLAIVITIRSRGPLMSLENCQRSGQPSPPSLQQIQDQFTQYVMTSFTFVYNNRSYFLSRRAIVTVSHLFISLFVFSALFMSVHTNLITLMVRKGRITKASWFSNLKPSTAKCGIGEPT